jgi:hypothetical protein
VPSGRALRSLPHANVFVLELENAAAAEGRACGQRVLTGDLAAKLWDLDRRACLASFSAHEPSSEGPESSAGNSRLLSTVADVMLWGPRPPKGPKLGLGSCGLPQH